MSAELMGALVRRAGHRIRMSGDATTATAEIVRRDDPEFTYRATFTLDDAKAAGLLGKDVWKRYPAAMLLARAVSAVCRAGAGDVLAGVSYVPEELGEAPDWVDEAPVTRLVAIEPEAEKPSAASPAEPPKRRRRTKAEMDEARRLEQEAAVEAIAEEPATVAESLEEEWENGWLLRLDAEKDAGNLEKIRNLGEEATAHSRPDLLGQAREAWSIVQQASAS
jgi:hypothetical protein